MSGNQFFQLFPVIFFAGSHNFNSTHNQPWGTEAALNSSLFNKGLLNRRKLSVRPLQAFYSHNAFSVSPEGQINAAVNGFSVYKNGAGSALTDLAAFFYGGQTKAGAEGIQKGFPLVNSQLCFLSIYFHMYNFKH